jgi:hypothetical protein
VLLFSAACNNTPKTMANDKVDTIAAKVAEYAPFVLNTDTSVLSANEKQMLPILLEAAAIMDDIFWKQAYGDKAALLAGIKDSMVREFVLINYGPWERLNDNKPFVAGIGAKPSGAGFYPQDMTKEEFEAFKDPAKTGLYSIIGRKADKGLEVIPYHVAYNTELTKASELVKKAALLAEDPGLKMYLELRAAALLSDDYFPSDMAWMDMRNNGVDFVIGPIESYEDQIFGYKASYEAYVLVKDKEWSSKVLKYAALLPKLQLSLPVADEYKKETPGTSSDLGVYDALYYAGDCNAGSKTIAINLPNDPKVQNLKGSRRLQLKNAMQAKFDKILLPISKLVIDKEQQHYVKFDAFFENVMFHEIAHGLGMNNTINGKGIVKDALKETYTSLEESKADILGLYLITQLNKMGEFKDKDLMENYVTFLAGIFRSVRFGAASAHGKANMIRFNYFNEQGAFTYDKASRTYKVEFEKMKLAMNSLSAIILKIQGDGDYEAALKLIAEKGNISPDLQANLDEIGNIGIPRDIIFKQGLAFYAK